jgi:hypothetical protein
MLRDDEKIMNGPMPWLLAGFQSQRAPVRQIGGGARSSGSA